MTSSRISSSLIEKLHNLEFQVEEIEKELDQKNVMIGILQMVMDAYIKDNYKIVTDKTKIYQNIFSIINNFRSNEFIVRDYIDGDNTQIYFWDEVNISKI